MLALLEAVKSYAALGEMVGALVGLQTRAHRYRCTDTFARTRDDGTEDQGTCKGVRLIFNNEAVVILLAHGALHGQMGRMFQNQLAYGVIISLAASYD